MYDKGKYFCIKQNFSSVPIQRTMPLHWTEVHQVTESYQIVGWTRDTS
jgi:hypothetical protein